MALPSVTLTALSPREQLTAGRLGRRVPQLVVGLALYGLSMAMMVRADLGLAPWDVLHVGLESHLPLSFGQVTMVVGALVLALWWPLRQWPGLGTVANVVVIGVVSDLGLALLPAPGGLVDRAALLLAGILLNGIAGGLYIGSQFGAGPRDGLMTGLARRTGWSLRLVRTGLELTVLVVGWLLGGGVGVGTMAYALLIGPIVHVVLPRVTVALPRSGATPDSSQPALASAKGSTADAPA